MPKKKWKYPTRTSGGRKGKSLPIYQCWYHMISLCNNRKNKDYHYYGARGITVCEEWLSYDNFYEWAMARGYEDNLTIIRIDTSGNYEPSNCRLAIKNRYYLQEI